MLTGTLDGIGVLVASGGLPPDRIDEVADAAVNALMSAILGRISESVRQVMVGPSEAAQLIAATVSPGRIPSGGELLEL